MNPSYYAIIPANVRYDKRLKANEKLMYGEITALSNKDGFCSATNSYFAKLYDVSQASVSSWISNLIKCGYIWSQFKYKEGTQEILYRSLSILDTPVQDFLIDNNTRYNNTSNLCGSNSELPLNIPKEKEEKPTKEESRVDWVLLIEHFNRVTGKKTKVISDKAKKQVLALLKSGYTKEDLAAAIKNCYEDPFHKENNHKHLTLEFISRPDKMEKYHYVKPTSQNREKGSL